MKNITYKIYTLGCKVNQYDSGDLGRKMKEAGFVLSEKNANIAIVNTCCVTKTAITKGKRIINKARIENPKAKIVLMGCFPKSYKEEAGKLNIDLLWGVGELNKLIKQISNFQFPISNQSSMIKFQDIEQDKARYFIKIQDGCEQFCSYCVIPYNRGGLKSRSREEIVEEIKRAVDNGYREAVLSGIHLGLYGRNRRCEKVQVEDSLVDLLRELIKIKNLKKIRLSSIEPMEVSSDLISLIKKEKKLCKHLHIPMQSGCGKILKAMNRPYGKKQFEKKINQIRKSVPDIAISADVIVGFPGESKTDFQETYDFVKKIKFSKLHVFSFSAHEKTPAFKMKDKVKREEINKRSAKLREIGKKLEREFVVKFKNKELDVVIQRIKGENFVGKTEYYFDVNFQKKDIVGDVEKIRRGEVVRIRKV